MESAISRFTTSLLAGSQENTFALAALNFDFSLYKVQAPTEYQALGSCLSDERRQMAESGPQHVTARKLGALFRSKLPHVPNLIRAYGQRVSDIAKIAASDSTIENLSRKSFLGDKIGIDGTSIWAAATSGTEALCVQLLACILARFWSPQEAISIWAEIVENRKSELLGRTGDFDFPEVAAVQAMLSREQLAEWDASARAWLRTADKCKSKQQTQLRLIVDNLDLEVNTTRSTYESVMEAWTSSMRVVDNLVAGVPQGIHEGAALVGLSSWHLYPDMLVFQPKSREIHQNDPLACPGGLLTVGLHSPSEWEKGVSWSLPLAKLRFYGDPVVVSRRLDCRDQQLSVQELSWVVIGCLAHSWPDVDDRMSAVCRYYQKLWSRFQASGQGDDLSAGGIRHIADAAAAFLNLKGEARTSAMRLMEYGLRRCPGFLDTSEGAATWEWQMLGMNRMDVFLSAMRRDREYQIKYIREVMRETVRVSKKPGDWLLIWFDAFTTCIATCFPDSATSKHYRWCTNNSVSTEQKKTTDKVLPMNGWKLGFYDNNQLILRLRQGPRPQDKFSSLYSVRLATSLEDIWEANFQRFFGSAKCGIQLYQDQRARQGVLMSRSDAARQPAVEIEDIMELLDNPALTIDKGLLMRPPPSLQAFGHLCRLYSSLPGASVSLKCTQMKIESMRWVRALTGAGMPPSEIMSSNIAFACIVMMETGDQNLDPDLLTNVMAIAIGDSIYTTSALISDPYGQPGSRAIVRALGNIGKAGVSLIIPPPSPRVREPQSNEWNVITHSTWDGKEQADTFDATSLHLLLTDYRVPYVTEHGGARDIQTSFQEAVISIYDGRTWVGDVDIIKALDNRSAITRLPEQCPHGEAEAEPEVWGNTTAPKSRRKKKKGKGRHELNEAPGVARRVRTIANWHELLDKPPEPVVVLTRGNWLARLAVATLSIQLGHKTTVLPKKYCEKGCFCDLEWMKNYVAKDGEVTVL